MKIRLEHSKCQVGKPTSLGLMVEITAPVAPVIEATAKKAKALVFVVDRSGSMSGNRIDMVKNTILDTLARLSPEDHICIVTFESKAVVVQKLKAIKELDLKVVRKLVSDIYADGSTDLEAGYRLALKELGKLPEGLEANIILLSDGQANAGETDPEVLGNIATAATEHMITTSTIGIGSGYDENILSALADGGNGNHFAGLSQGEALDALHSEIDGLLQKTMLDIEFEIVLGPDFTGPKSKISAGRRMKKWRAKHAEVRALLGDLASGEERNVYFDFLLDAHPMSTPGVKQGVKITYSYTDVLTGEKISKTETLEIELVAEADWVEPVRDADIQAELMLVRGQQIYDQVVELLAQGKRAEADALLESAGEEIRKFMEENHLSARQLDRMNATSANFMNLNMVQDLNMKSKLLREYRSSSIRDRRNKPRDEDI